MIKTEPRVGDIVRLGPCGYVRPEGMVACVVNIRLDLIGLLPYDDRGFEIKTHAICVFQPLGIGHGFWADPRDVEVID